jgi:hypothetical protein
MRDATEHERPEQQPRECREKQIAAALNVEAIHHFGNLLSGIEGYTSLCLREPNLSPILRRLLQRVKALAGDTSQLLEQLMALARKSAQIPMRTLRTLLAETDGKVSQIQEYASLCLRESNLMSLPQEFLQQVAALAERATELKKSFLVHG